MKRREFLRPPVTGVAASPLAGRSPDVRTLSSRRGGRSQDLESYAGVYTSDQIHLGIKAFVKDGKLCMQGTGQPEFPLKAASATRFEFPQAGVVIDSDASSSFTLKQAGTTSRFNKAPSQQ